MEPGCSNETNTSSPCKLDCDLLVTRVKSSDTKGVREWLETWKQTPDLCRSFLACKPDIVCSAAEAGSPEIIDLLVLHGFKVYCTSVHAAACRGHLKVMQKLVDELDLSVDSEDAEGRTPLMWSVYWGHVDIVAYLLSRGACVDYVMKDIGVTSLFIAAYLGYTKIARQLLDAGADVNKIVRPVGCAFNKAVSVNKIDMAKLLVEKGAKIDIPTEHGQNAFYLALVMNPDVEMVKFLLEINFPLNESNDRGHTAVFEGLCTAPSSEVLLWVHLVVQSGYRVTKRDYEKARARFANTEGKLVLEQLKTYMVNTRTLQQLCSFKIRQILGVSPSPRVRRLPIPAKLKDYIELKHLTS
ncbi:serine/threonine-protein phosphatase 6 regulatory ankyrin repeat subunit C-like isoform X1 [Haliotis rufescens]|uniref:serine/threonine-protein phosphatase 6 regulatory ankyrin repeat subunit C-like isoform X1 n=1 Tax=Haliotis rufescens TaxID=6454 RepID=UPI00201EF6DA|nr:serine/threonine-protein phosphatase 6 regulatory ankyrin repeat subunit C-like isoform X1 [Haliotis rufescens]